MDQWISTLPTRPLLQPQNSSLSPTHTLKTWDKNLIQSDQNMSLHSSKTIPKISSTLYVNAILLFEPHKITPIHPKTISTNILIGCRESGIKYQHYTMSHRHLVISPPPICMTTRESWPEEQLRFAVNSSFRTIIQAICLVTFRNVTIDGKNQWE